MTRDEAKKLLPIIQAYADGYEIEFKLNANCSWDRYNGQGAFYPEIGYRIKPKAREWWILEGVSSDVCGIYHTLEPAIRDMGTSNKLFHVREVLPEDGK